MAESSFRSGFVAIVGRPNVGKSTLLNALVGRKVSIVTPRPQTTRHAILGVVSSPDAQILFVDTPGLHSRMRNLLNRAMNRAVEGAITGADLALMVVEATGWQRGDDHVLEHVRRANIPCLLAVSKIDLIRPRSMLLPVLKDYAERTGFQDIVPISAARDKNLDRLLSIIAARLPAGPPLYPLDAITDRSREFRVAEVIREQLLLALRDEVPYGLAVQVTEIEERKGMMLVDALIWAERESHKGIVVGRGGLTLKEIGTAARLELEKLFECRVYLETHVKVKRNWADNARTLQQFGFEGTT